jgi:YD repeat-containing protein
MRSDVLVIAMSLLFGLCLVSCGEKRNGSVPTGREKVIEKQIPPARVTESEKRTGYTEVRDRQGRLIEKRTRQGNRTEVRDASGRLLRVETEK